VTIKGLRRKSEDRTHNKRNEPEYDALCNANANVADDCQHAIKRCSCEVLYAAVSKKVKASEPDNHPEEPSHASSIRPSGARGNSPDGPSMSYAVTHPTPHT
jgi:hypothetical protein